MSASALNMERIVRAREHHDRTCPLGPATEVLLNAHDVGRLGWEDGDQIGGLTIAACPSIPLGAMRIVCDAEGNGEGLSREAAVEDLNLVGA